MGYKFSKLLFNTGEGDLQKHEEQKMVSRSSSPERLQQLRSDAEREDWLRKNDPTTRQSHADQPIEREAGDRNLDLQANCKEIRDKLESLSTFVKVFEEASNNSDKSYAKMEEYTHKDIESLKNLKNVLKDDIDLKTKF